MIDGSDQGDQFWQHLYVLRRRWWLILGCGLLAFAFRPRHVEVPEYSAEGVVQRKDERAAAFGGVNLAPPNLISELEILRSGGVLDGATDSLGLRVVAGGVAPPRRTLFAAVRSTRDALPGTYTLRRIDSTVTLTGPSGQVVGKSGSDLWIHAHGIDLQLASAAVPVNPTAIQIIPQEDALNVLKRGLNLVQVPGTNLIRISYRGSQPEQAALIVNGVMRAYQEFSSRTARDDARRRRETIATQLAAIADSLAIARQQVVDYQTRSGTLDPKDQGGVIATTLVASQTELRTLRYQEGILQSLLAGLRVPGSNDDAVRRVIILGKDIVPTVGDLYGKLQGYITERSQITAGRAGLTRGAVRVEALDSLIAGVKVDIRGVTEQSLTALRNRLRVAESRTTELEIELAKYPGRASIFSRLAQRADAVQATYNMMAGKYYEAQISEQVDPAKVEIIQAATTPRSPIPGQTKRSSVVYLVLGSIAGIGLAFLLEVIDRKIRTPADVARATNVQLLTCIPYFPALKPGKADSLVMINNKNQVGAEAFRLLRTATLFARARRSRVVAVTSSIPGEGKSLIAANFAIAMASQGTSVLLIDCDLRRSTVHELFHIPKSPGLTDALVNGTSATVYPAHLQVQTLQILPAGSTTTSPAELLGSKEFATLINSLLERFELIVIDTPPVLAVSDASSVMRLIDGVLVVARSGLTDRFALGHTMARLRQVDAPVLGVVLNGVQQKGGLYSGYGDYGYYGGAYAKYYVPEVESGKGKVAAFIGRVLG